MENSNAQKFAIGIDIGGTTTKFGIVDAKGEIIVQDRIPSNQHDVVENFVDDLYQKLNPMIDKVGGIKNFVGIGVGAQMEIFIQVLLNMHLI